VSQKIVSLKQNSAELRGALLDGVLGLEGQVWKVLPREVAYHPIGIESVIFEATPLEQAQKPHVRKWFLSAIRPQSLGLSLGPAAVVWLSGFWDQAWVFSPQRTAFVFLLLLCLQIAVHLLNDVEDHLRLVDRPGMVGGSGVIQKGWVSAKTLQRWGWAFWGLAIFFGLILLGDDPVTAALPSGSRWVFSKNSWMADFFGVLGVLGVIGFATGPWAARYRRFGNVLVFFLAGPVLALGVSQALFHRLGFREFLLGLFFGWIAWATFHSKHLQTFDADRQAGVTHLAVWMGYSRAKPFLGLLYFLGYLSLGIGVFLGEIPPRVFCFVLLGLPIIFGQMKLVYRASGPASVWMGQLRPRGNQIQITLAALTLIGFLLKF
jgi:hypothetical protein